jgi:trigger factor
MAGSMTSTETVTEPVAEEKPKPKQKLNLEVWIDKPGDCQRHVTVTISEEDVLRYLDEAYSALLPKAQVPGFRSGKAPRKLVESRFKTEVTEQVKGSLIMDSMTQITDEHDFSAISEPDFDFAVIEIPDEGPLTFEFDLEVRPEFDLPKWQGLALERPTHQFTRKDVDQFLETALSRKGRLVPFDGAAEAGDYVVVNIVSSRNGGVISRAEEQTVRIRRYLSFPDGRLNHFDELMVGAQAGDKKTATVMVSHDAPRLELQGVQLDLEFEVLEVKKLEPPKLDEEELLSLFGVETEGDLRDHFQRELERRLSYQQQQSIRDQITRQLTASAKWDLPPDLVRRQSRRELDRAVLELRSAGYAEDEIQSFENDLRRNSEATTRKALKEHFMLEKIAEVESIDATEADYEEEIKRIAVQAKESVRRIRARMEKRGLMDALRNQIIERKVIDLITSHAKFKDVPYEPTKHESEGIEYFICGQSEVSIPVAKHAGEAKELPQHMDRT